MKTVIAALAACLVVPAFAREVTNPRTGSALALKPSVVDGDTVSLNGVTHRILGLDTPETFQPQCEQEAAKGYQAAGRLSHLIRARGVRLEPTGKRDRYGRELSRLYVGGEDVADILIREGLARPYTGGRRQSWCPTNGSRPGAY